MLGRIGYICLLSIVCLSVGNAYLLNLGELLRIAAIGLGLLAYYWFHLRALQGEASVRPQQMVSILALISVFLLVQFDPAYAGINRSIPQGFLNWYAVITSILTIAAFGSVLLDTRSREAGGGWSLAAQFSRWDWSVMTASALTLLLIAITSRLQEVPTGPANFSILKLLLGVLLYTATVGLYRGREGVQAHHDKQDDARRKWEITWKVLGGAFLAVLLIGVGKSIYVQAQLANGADLLQGRLHAEAVAPLESVLNLSGGRHEEGQIALAEAFLGIDDITAASAQILSARQLYPGSETLEKRIGDAFSRNGHWDRAIDTYLTAGRKRKDEFYFFDELALAYLISGKSRELTEMIRQKDRAPAVELESTENQVHLAMSLVEAGRFSDAKREIDGAAAQSSADWLVEYGKGVLANRTQDWQSGVEFLRRAVELGPQQLEPRLELGEALIELGRFEAAGEHAAHVLESHPDRILALGQLASVRAARADTSGFSDLVRKMTIQIGYSQWQGPQKGGLGAAGACWYDLELYPGELSLSINASGTEAIGVWPLMIVSIDQVEIGSVSVNRSDTYRFQTQIEAPGTYRLSVYFPNDSTADQPGDRNLFVSDATLQYLRVAR
jgi:tetratricopeptide (TPR) repeat protein